MGNGKRTRRFRKSIRLRGYDYAQPGAYFVTACSHMWGPLFGRVQHDEMLVGRYGGIVQACWHETPLHFPSAELDAFQVMPNHIHGILFIAGQSGEGFTPHARLVVAPCGPDHPVARGPARGSVGAIVGSLKSAATRHINRLRGRRGPPLWQPNYHEHIIRSERELYRIRDYIVNNPANWASDRENPVRTGSSALEEEIFRDYPRPPRKEQGQEDDSADAQAQAEGQ